VKKLKKGPDLKMPELKVPAFLVDLYYDLRDRRLLPLVALAIVAIVAVPFLLGGSDAEEEAPVADRAPSALEADGASASSLTVVKATPGLRDYRRRLRRRSAEDPFHQRYTSPVLKGTKLGGGDDGSSTGTTTSTSTTKVTKTTEKSEGKTTTEVTTQTNESSDTTTGKGQPQDVYSFAIDVKIVQTTTAADGTAQTGEPIVRHGVLPPSALPAPEAQVVTYMGINPETRKPLLLISDEVTAIFGEAKCLSGARTCQLIEVETGFPETFVFGPESVRYKINVLKVSGTVAG